jgi:hypothetical protein
LAHRHAGAEQDRGAVLAGSVRAHTGQVYFGQHVVGSVPTATGICPSAHTCAIAGHDTRVRSHVGVCGTHWPMHVRPLHAPLASQTQLGSFRSQPQAGGVGGTRLPVAGSVVVIGVPPPVLPPLPGMHAHSRHWTSHIWPIGQSVLAWQPVCGTLGTQMP